MNDQILFCLLAVILNLACSTFLAVLFAIKRRDLKHYISFNLSIGIWSLLYIPWLLINDPTVFEIFARLLLVSIVVIPYTFLNVCFEISNTLRPKWVRFYNLIGLISFSALAFTPLLISGVYSPATGFTNWPIAGPLHPLYLVYFAMNCVYGQYILLKTLPSNSKVAYIIIGTLVGFSGGATNFFLWYQVEIPPLGNGLVSLYANLILKSPLNPFLKKW
ncbi:hypothetical protein EBR96_05590 [bacterium]|nr:hypothetical protein [bacterium]